MSDIFTEFEKVKAAATNTPDEGDSSRYRHTGTPMDAETRVSSPQPSTTTESQSASDETKPVSTAPETTEGSATPADAGVDSDDFDFEAFRREHPKAAKQYEASLTKMRQKDSLKVQEQVKEALKDYDGVDKESISLVREINRKLQTNPTEALQMIETIRQNIQRQYDPAGYSAGQTDSDPLANFVPQTDAEYYLAEKLRSMDQTFQQVMPLINDLRTQNTQAQYNTKISNEFSALETKLNTKLGEDERQEIHNFAVQNHIPTMEYAYKVLNFEKAQQKAANKAASVVQRKAQSAPVPQSVSPRETADSPTMPDNIHDIFRLVKEQYSTR